MKPIKGYNIIKIKDGQQSKTEDHVAIEEPLQISISIPEAQPQVLRKNIAITMRTPGEDEELAIGFLFSEGIIHSRDQIGTSKLESNKINLVLRNVDPSVLESLDRHFYTSSSCGVCGKASIEAVHTSRIIKPLSGNFKIDSKVLSVLPQRLRSNQSAFNSTGAIHAAAFFNLNGKLLSVSEDVGRHNALDKLLGKALKQSQIPIEDKILLLSGRASFELIQKAMMAGIYIIAAVGAPSSLAVDLAKESNITLIGFLKNDRFNIYSLAERIIL